MEQVLSLSARPRTLDALVGQDFIVASIRKRIAKRRLPKAFLFHGPLGCGKTSIARILALSLQCTHQEKFGVPCIECRRNYRQYHIDELNAGRMPADKVSAVLQAAWLTPMGASTYRIFIIDEPQGLHKVAQRELLKYLEDCPPTTIFILATTEPYALLDTILSRCTAYEVRGLTTDEITLLVTRLLKKVQSDLPADRLVEMLVERGIKYPRFIAQAVETYAAEDGDLAGASKVNAAEGVDINALTRAVIKGDWQDAAAYLERAQSTDARPIRLGLIRYMRGMLLTEFKGGRAQAWANGIRALAQVQFAEDTVVAAAIAAEVYKLTIVFQEYKG